MNAVIPAPQGYKVFFGVEEPELLARLKEMSFSGYQDKEPCIDILIVDNLSALDKTNHHYAIFLDTYRAPFTLPENTILFQVQSGESFHTDLIELISTISEGHAPSLLNIQATHISRITGSWKRKRYEIYTISSMYLKFELKK